MQLPALEKAPESKAPRTATADRVPVTAEETAHQPFISADQDIPELTPVPLIVGALLGILFGASSMYLVLKVGLTVSASIPVAVLSITIFRGFTRVFRTRRATILENNITQTAGSAGESIAFGVGVTMPALLILGYNLEISQVILVSILGGLLGVLMMIPLRRALIVKEAKTLVYPEGTACAEVLISGETGGTTAKTVFAGLGVGGAFALGYKAFGFFKDIPEKIFGKWYDGGNLSIEVGPELMGVGYIIGTRIAMIMGAGGILSSLVLMPAIKLFGRSASSPIYPATNLIRDMSTDDVWRSYILYIGAGAVAAGGIISLFKSLPTIVGGAMRGMRSLRGATGPAGTLRTDRDIPLPVVAIGSLLIVVVCALVPSFKLNVLGALLILVLGFLFVTVSSRLTGEVGSSSNPISGMTVATLLITSLIFFALGWVTPPYKIAALSVAAVVCVAISNGGSTSQDLKTGYLVGATPSRQQIAILCGAFASALVLGFVILKLNDAGTVFAARNYDVQFSPSEFSGEKEHLRGADADRDHNAYNVVWLREPRGDAPPGKYLVDDSGRIKYLEDPGINGKIDRRDNGEKVKSKFSAPKPVLMAFIIEGIMTQRRRWDRVRGGVSREVVREVGAVGRLPVAGAGPGPLGRDRRLMLGLLRATGEVAPAGKARLDIPHSSSTTEMNTPMSTS